MQKKVLLSSVLVIALCLSVIAGTTFALFTDEKSTNIAITSGDVEVEAKLDIANIYSAVKNDAYVDQYLVDENGHFYDHIAQANNTFLNGGTADLTDNVITLTNITPGDKIDATITVKNVGNVAMIYRWKIQADSSKLADGMVVTTDTDYEGMDLYVSEWSAVVNAGDAATTHDFSIELPVYAGNEYQSETEGEDGTPAGLMSANYTITVEAVQGNADVSEYVAPESATVNTVTTLAELQAALDDVGNAAEADVIINLGADITGNATVTQFEGKNLTINGNGYKYDGVITIGADGASTQYEEAPVTIKDIDFIADSLDYDAFIRLGNGKAKEDPTKSRYICNVTVSNCQFTDTDASQKIVAVKSYTGGDKNLVIENCVVNAGMHSFLQTDNIDGITINNCRVYSKNGINLVNSKAIEINNCTFNVLGYAVRTDVRGYYVINNSVLKSACAESDDAVIVLRKAAVEEDFILNNTTLTGVRGFFKK